MRPFFYSLGFMLAVGPLGAQAQAPAPPHLYVGLAAYASNYLPLGRNELGGFPLPLQATVGYQLRPRWAVQASLAYAGRGGEFSSQIVEYRPGQAPASYRYAGQSRQRLLTTSVLGRYTLTRQAAHRLQVEALGGLAWVHQRYRSTYTRTDSAGVVASEAVIYSLDNLLLSVGLGARYRFAPRFEAAYNFLLGVPLAGHYAGGPLPSTALGVQYQLSRR